MKVTRQDLLKEKAELLIAEDNLRALSNRFRELVAATLSDEAASIFPTLQDRGGPLTGEDCDRLIQAAFPEESN